MIEYLAELVVTDTADVAGPPAEVRKSRNRVRDGTARHLRRRAHHFVNFMRTLLVDESHRAGHDPDLFDECIVDVSEHVHDGVTDAEKLDIIGHLTVTPG